MIFGRFSKSIALAATISVAVFVVFAALPVLASSKSDDAMRRMQERAQEQARQQQERERARQEREQARQQARQEREQAREQARQEREQAKVDREQGKSEQGKTLATEQAATSTTKDTATAADQGKTSDSGKTATIDDKTVSPAEKARIERDKTRRDIIEDDKVPGTVAEWFSGLLKPSAPAPVPPSPVAKLPVVAHPATPAPAPGAKTTAAKQILVTGSTPVTSQAGPPVNPAVSGTAKSPIPQAATTTAKAAPKVAPIRPDSGLPSFPPQAPEVLANKLTPQNIERAVALGFKVNGVSGVSRLDLTLTRLIAPDGFSADQARALLRLEMPGTAVGVNQTYRIYRTATGALPASQSDQVRPAQAMPTSCGTDRCFGQSIIKWQASLQACSRGTKVGVIDTGYDATHPTFRARVIEARTSVAIDRARSPDWHGTGVMALLAGDALSGTPGLIPDARFFLADIFYAGADGLPSSDTASLIDALEWLDKRRVSVVNMSLSGPPDDLLKQAIEGLSAKGIIFVAAAGNDGPSAPPSYPAAYSSVIAVTAVGRDMKSYRHASRGDPIDVAAPGVDIWTALPGGQGSYHSGTSFAVPYVTAVLATAYMGLAVKNKAEFLKRATIVDLGEPGRDPIYGRGLLQAPSACAASVPVASVKTPMATPAGLIGQATPLR